MPLIAAAGSTSSSGQGHPNRAPNTNGPTSRVTTTNSAYGTSVTLTVSGSTVAGDLLFAALASSGGSLSTPSGWTRATVVTSELGVNMYYCTLYVFTKVAVSGDIGSNLTFTYSAPVNLGIAGAMLSIANPTSRTGLTGVQTGTAGGTTLTAPTAPALIGRRPMRLNIFCMTPDNLSAPTFSAYSGEGNVAANLASSTFGVRLSVYENAAATNPAAATITSDRTGSSVSASATIRS